MAKYILFFIVTGITFLYGALSLFEKSEVPIGYNTLKNGGFEAGISGWTAGGSSTLVVVDDGLGARAGQWDPSAGSETLESDQSVGDPGGSNYEVLAGQNGLARCYIKTAATDVTWQVVDSSDGGLSASETITADSSNYKRHDLTFIFPSNGIADIMFTSASDSATMNIDNCYLGLADNIIEVSQAALVAVAHYPATSACEWPRTSTTLGATADTSCPGITEDYTSGGVSIDGTDDDLPTLVLNNLSPGRYVVTATFPARVATAAAQGTFALNDGTSTEGHTGGRSVDGADEFAATIVGTFEYTAAQSSVTYTVYSSATSGATQINLAPTTGHSPSLTFTVVRYPLSSQLVAQVDGFKYAANVVAGTTGRSCSITATSFTDCNDSDFAAGRTNYGSAVDPADTGDLAIAVNNLPAGAYAVIANGPMYSSDTANDGTITDCFWTISDGSTVSGSARTLAGDNDGANDFDAASTLIGFFNYTSQANREWVVQADKNSGTSCDISLAGTERQFGFTVIPLDQFKGVTVLDQVTTPGGNTKFAMVSANISNSGTPSISQENGDFIDTIDDDGVGNIGINFNTSFWAAAPSCSVTAAEANSRQCRATALPTTSSLETQCSNHGTGDVDIDFIIICHGQIN